MKDSLGDRMKEYECNSKPYLSLEQPVIGRIDGKAFHTLTNGMGQPWDDDFISCMEVAAKALMAEVQGCKIAYFQSDEISLLIDSNHATEQQAWFGNNLSKLCSVAASIASTSFLYEYMVRFPLRAQKIQAADLEKRTKLLPKFDARFFNIPELDIKNYFHWRQADCIRNSKNTLGRQYFSHKQLMGIPADEVILMLKELHQVDWSALPDKYKFGLTVVKEQIEKTTTVLIKDQEPTEFTAQRTLISVLNPTPIFIKEKDFFNNLLG